MTNSPVKAVGSFVDQLGASQKSNTSNTNGNFGEIFGQTYNKTDQNKSNLAETTQISKTPPVRTDRNGSNPSQVETDKKAELVDQTKTADEKLEGTGEQLVEAVAKELGMTVEEVVKAMEALGITPMDLLNQDIMTQLFMSLADTDMLTVLTNDAQYQSLQNLLGNAEEQLGLLQSELGMKPDELQALIDQMKQPELQEPVPDSDLTQKAPGQTETADANGKMEEATGEAVNMTEELQKPMVPLSAEGEGEMDVDLMEVRPETVSQTKNHSEQSDSNSKQQSSKDQNSKLHILTDANVYNEVKTENVVEFDEIMGARAGDTKDIARQILDFMRVQVKMDVTQMQIQLNPVDLGTINISIMAKDGVITAQFLAQTEAVKAVIESQIFQLRNTFEEQGLKVEAVEVAVESHSFERSPGEPGFGQSEQEQQNNRKTTPRRLNLSELSMEEEAELDDTEQLAVEIMQASGSTVDFTV